MANKPFDTTVIYPLERPLSSDINSGESQSHRDLRDFLYRFYGRRDTVFNPSSLPTTGFVADGFRAVPTSPVGLSITLTAGQGYAPNPDPQAAVNGIIGLSDLSPYSPLLLSSAQNLTVPAAPGAGFCRVDLIQVRVDRYLTDVSSRDVFNPGTLTFGPQNIAKTMSFDLLGRNATVISPAVNTTGIGYKVGATVAYVNADTFLTAPRPAVDPGYVAVAYINVNPTTAAIQANDIVDARPLLFPAGEADLSQTVLLGPTGPIAGVSPATPAQTFAGTPPGADVVVATDTSPGPNTVRYTVYLFAGDLNLYETAPYTYFARGLGGTELVPANVETMVVSRIIAASGGLLTNAERNALATAGVVQSPVSVAVGQTYKKFTLDMVPMMSGVGGVIEVSTWNNGTLTVTPTPAELGATKVGFQMRRAL